MASLFYVIRRLKLRRLFVCFLTILFCFLIYFFTWSIGRADNYSSPPINNINLHYGNLPEKQNNATTGKIGQVTILPGSVEEHAVLNNEVVFHVKYLLSNGTAMIQNIIKNKFQFREMQRRANKTLRYIMELPSHFDENSGACKCGKISDNCTCCAQVGLEKLHFSHQACVNFTYMVMKKALRVTLLYDNLLVVQRLLDITQPAVICVGDLLELCVVFRKLRYAVDITSNHKTRFQGCVDLHLRLLEKNIYIYQLGCFMSLGESGVHADKIANWVP